MAALRGRALVTVWRRLRDKVATARWRGLIS